MAGKKTFEFDGIRYVLKNGLTWGEELDVGEESINDAISISDVIAGSRGDKKVLNRPINVKKMSMRSVMKSLVEWTFRGYNKENDELLLEGDILEINEENLMQIPAGHGNKMSKFIEGENNLSEYEVKN